MLHRWNSVFISTALFVTLLLMASSISVAQTSSTPQQKPVAPQKPISIIPISASRMVGSTGWTLVTGLPYSLRETITTVHVFSRDSTTNLVREQRQMRDSAGRVRTEVGHLEDGNLVIDAIEIRDVAARTLTVLMPGNSTARVMHVSAPAAPAPAAQTAALHITVDKLPSQSLAGILTEGTRTTRVIPEQTEGNDIDISVVTESWRSPELKIVMLMTQDDPRKDKHSEEVIELSRSEPDTALFQIPDDYTVVDDSASYAPEE